MPDTWAATDALGRVLPMSTEVGVPKPNRTVGIFYFNWHAAFGNKEVHDIAKILAANPATPPWGPLQAPHYWSEPRFGYYRPDDPWVIRKHVQMLTDAGVDVLILDATNGFTYDAERKRELWPRLTADIALTLHWRGAKAAADDDGRFSIGLRISVADGAPAKLKVRCAISRTITDEVESEVEDPGQMRLL